MGSYYQQHQDQRQQLPSSSSSSSHQPNNTGANQSLFGTVLVARKSNVQPTELEFKLRACAQRLRVVEKLSGGAHLLLPVSETTIAVRAYLAKDIVQMEKEYRESCGGDEESNERSRRYLEKLCRRSGSGSLSNIDLQKSFEKEKAKSGELDEKNVVQGSDEDDEDIDGLRAFRDSFKYPIVFFVLPPGEMQQDQLGRSNSVVNQMQRALLSYKHQPSNSQDKRKGGQKAGAARIFIVPEVATVLRTIVSVIDSIKPEKRKLKQKFFAKEASDNFLPDLQTHLVPSEDAVAKHVANAFQKWAERFEIPLCDANILLSVLGSLGRITSADRSVLDTIPVNQSTKDALIGFFGFSSERSKNDLNQIKENLDTTLVGAGANTLGQETLTQDNPLQITKQNTHHDDNYALQQIQKRAKYTQDRNAFYDNPHSVSASTHSMATNDFLPPPPFAMNIQHQTVNFTPMQAPTYRPEMMAQGHSQMHANHLQSNRAFPSAGIFSQQEAVFSQPVTGGMTPYASFNHGGNMRGGMIQNQTYHEEVSYPGVMPFHTQRSQRHAVGTVAYGYGQHNLNQIQGHSQQHAYR